MTKIKRDAQAGPVPILCAHPVVLVGANVDGHPDFAAVAWTGVAASFPPSITIALQPHRHSLKGIRQNMTFSVNLPSIEYIKETDYCGLVSGAMSDKAADCAFKVFYGDLSSAPLIEQFPVNHACEVLHMLSLGSHVLVVGKIVETYYSDEFLSNGKLDIEKVRPFFFSHTAGYYRMGRRVGKSFHIGSVVNPAKVKEARKRSPPPPPRDH
jgi:flavin reductase (DIM6/NTAB) family NADH-FMN oxidoreductase RutF